MSSLKNERFARLWLATVPLPDGPDDAYGRRPQQLLRDLQDTNPERVLELVLLIAQRTSDPWKLSMLGAGRLEDLLRHHPEMTLSALEAAMPAGLRQALLSVWMTSLPQETVRRIDRLRRD